MNMFLFFFQPIYEYCMCKYSLHLFDSPVIMTYQLLIKDPEIHSKTWMITMSKHGTVAEIVGRFLIKRGSGHLSQPCLLRMSHGNSSLTEAVNMDKTLDQLGLPSRGVILHTMWSVSAGHISSKCAECKRISELVATGAHRKSIAAADVATIEDLREDARGDDLTATPPKQEKGRKVKSREKDLAKKVESSVQGGSTVEIMKSLERMVSVCLTVGDVADRLERLSEMRRSGELTDSEYSKAKSRLLE